MGSKAMNIVYCRLNAEEFYRISMCTRIQDTLKVTYEGTIQVKESKINIIVHKYKLFKMSDTMTISKMLTRFTDIIKSLKVLGRDITNVELVTRFYAHFQTTRNQG